MLTLLQVLSLKDFTISLGENTDACDKMKSKTEQCMATMKDRLVISDHMKPIDDACLKV